MLLVVVALEERRPVVDAEQFEMGSLRRERELRVSEISVGVSEDRPHDAIGVGADVHGERDGLWSGDGPRDMAPATLHGWPTRRRSRAGWIQWPRMGARAARGRSEAAGERGSLSPPFARAPTSADRARHTSPARRESACRGRAEGARRARGGGAGGRAPERARCRGKMAITARNRHRDRFTGPPSFPDFAARLQPGDLADPGGAPRRPGRDREL